MQLTTPSTVEELKQMDTEQLEALVRRGRATPAGPSGCARRFGLAAP